MPKLIVPLFDIIKSWFPQGEQTEEVRVVFDSLAEQKPNILREKSKVHEYSTRDFEAAWRVVFVRRLPTFHKAHTVFFWPAMNSTNAFFLTGDNTCSCFKPFLLSCRSHGATYLSLFHFQSVAAAAAVRRLVQDDSRKQGVCSLSPGYTP